MSRRHIVCLVCLSSVYVAQGEQVTGRKWWSTSDMQTVRSRGGSRCPLIVICVGVVRLCIHPRLSRMPRASCC